MTNSYDLSLKPKIVFFHGLNNNPECFGPLIHYFIAKGYETELVVLPCHGLNRREASNAKEALTVFDQCMKKLEKTPYYAVAFSHGALYLQLWLEKNLSYKPLKQVLLAPALFIHRQKLIETALKILPRFTLIKSAAPKPFRRYHMLSAWEYRILVDGIVTWQKVSSSFRIPTAVYIDPKDELVDAATLKKELERSNDKFSVHYFERPYLKKGFGCHHILFHPEYFSQEDWTKLTRKIETFLIA